MKEVDEIDEASEAPAAAAPQGDPEVVCLSPSVAKVLLEKTPAHAYTYHRLLGGLQKEDTDATEDGKIYEAIIFDQVKEKLTILKYDSYRTDAAKAAKASVVAAKKTPVLEKDWAAYAEEGMAMLKGIHDKGIRFTGGTPQALLRWKSMGVECKGYADYITKTPDVLVIDDLKCVEDASPAAMQRAIYDYGWDIQAAAYMEGGEAAYPEYQGRSLYRLIACEKKKPFAVAIYTLSGSFQFCGTQRWTKAKELWLPCITNNIWPGYKDLVIDATPWQTAKAEAISGAQP